MRTAGNNDARMVKTGITGLDEILKGGLARGSIHLVEGRSGTGKTTLGLQFSLEGMQDAEKVLYFTLSETRQELERVARSHGWQIDGLHILEVGSNKEQASSMFHPSEVELGQAIGRLQDEVAKVKPARVVLDSLSEFRILGQNSIRYRRELMNLKRFLGSQECTVLMLDISSRDDEGARELMDGVIDLEASAPDYGTDRRRLRVLKMRGKSYVGGFHDFIIHTGGIQVFPRLIAAEHRQEHTVDILHSGLRGLDELLGGGIRTGSSTQLVGPAGTGKSSIAMLFAQSALSRGAAALYFTFEERPEQLLARAKGLKIDLQTGLEKGLLLLQQVDPAELSPGHFAQIIRQQVESRETGVVVIDSLNGYMHSLRGASLTMQLHELLTYLSQNGVSTFLVMGQTGMGLNWETPADTSYLADAVLLFRFFEVKGEVRRALLVLKQRSGTHEHTIRELRLVPGGITISEPLRQFQGLIQGSPVSSGVSDRIDKGAQ
ncbi:MAG: circadian clock protein KaiC [Desulfobacteraceae bacterium]|nr:MAG: circadian clock protein KaiC [Desulfobacteraceae bacterium]